MNRRRKSGKQSKHFRFPAELPPKIGESGTRIRYYATRELAISSRNRAWADFKAAEELNKISKSTSDFSPRASCLNRSELKFIDWASKRGLQANRNGWPDFLVKNPKTGGIVGIEVKSGNGDSLSLQQVRCFRLLGEAGFSVYVFIKSKNQLVPWTEFSKTRSGTAPDAKIAKSVMNQ